MRVLLVEDDARTASFIEKGLVQAGFVVESVSDGKDGLHKALTNTYDAAVVDIMLPSMDGITMVREFRNNTLLLPVIFLSAKNSVDDRIHGLQEGGDDYLTKPFAFSELLARLQALIRRAQGTSEPTRLSVADLHMDLLSRKVWREEEEITLQPLEFALLEYLMRNSGRVVSKTMIMEHVWDYNFDPETNVVEARMCRLRDKIDRPFERKLVHTIRGVGYILRNDG